MRPAGALLVIGTLALASAAGAAERVRGAIDRTPPCGEYERYADGRITLTLTLLPLDGWPEPRAIDLLQSCDADGVYFESEWDEARARALLAGLEGAGVVEETTDQSACARDLASLCAGSDGVGTVRFDRDRPRLDRCTGTCSDGEAVRAFHWRVLLPKP